MRGNSFRKVLATLPVHGRTTEPVPPFGLPAPEQRIPCSNAQANWPNQRISAEGDGSVTFTGCFAALFPVIFPASGKTAETGSHRTASRTTQSGWSALAVTLVGEVALFPRLFRTDQRLCGLGLTRTARAGALSCPRVSRPPLQWPELADCCPAASSRAEPRSGGPFSCWSSQARPTCKH